MLVLNSIFLNTLRIQNLAIGFSLSKSRQGPSNLSFSCVEKVQEEDKKLKGAKEKAKGPHSHILFLRYFSEGLLRGGGPPVGKTQARNPTAKPEVGQDLLGKGDLGPAAGAVLMRTTCVRGAPRICDTRVIRGVVHHG